MITFQKTPVKSEIEGDGRLSAGTLGYLCARNRDAWFDYVHQKLAAAEARGVKRSDIAARLGKSPSRLSKLLAAPGNWTLDTVTELLVAIDREEAVPSSASLLRPKPRNSSSEAILADHCSKQATYKVEIDADLPQQAVISIKITQPQYAEA